jgi:hypothetical protein
MSRIGYLRNNKWEHKKKKKEGPVENDAVFGSQYRRK